MKKLIFLLLLIPLIGLSNQKDSIYTKVSSNKDTLYIAMDTQIGKLIYHIWVTKPLDKNPVLIQTTQKQLTILVKNEY
jgi:hypothetical protein